MEQKLQSVFSFFSKGGVPLLIIANVVFGVAVYVSLLSIDPLSGKSKVDKKERRIASVFSIKESPKAFEYSEFKMNTIDLDCLTSGIIKPIVSRSKFLRVKGKVCGLKKGQLLESQLLNRSNGYEATVFDLAGYKFTSEYITLNPGENKVLIQSKIDGERTITSELTIDFQDPNKEVE